MRNLLERLAGDLYYYNKNDHLSLDVRNELEKYPLDARKDIVNRCNHYSGSPLFIACQHGQHKIAEYLIRTCGADIEQKGRDGRYGVRPDVTPLWCGAFRGNLSIVQLLLQSGADINAESKIGSTPLMAACLRNRFEVVKYLVRYGVNLNKQNYKGNGEACPMNPVHTEDLRNFDINAKDNQNKTALHYSIEKCQLETTKLLLEHGADYTAKSRDGDDALQTACLSKAIEIFKYLTLKINYSPERIANAHELLGTRCIADDSALSLDFWRQALYIREENSLHPKQPVMTLQESYQKQREFETLDELVAMSRDVDKMSIQTLLIFERILGTYHTDFITRLWAMGKYYANLKRYQRCIDLWRRALQIRTETDTILHTKTSSIAQALVLVMLEFNIKSVQNNIDNAEQRFHNIVETFKLLSQNFGEIGSILLIREQFKVSITIFRCISHLIYLLIKTAKTKNNRELVTKLLHRVINFKCLSTGRGFNGEEIKVFPDVNVLKQLLECGANVHAKNKGGWSPLHVAVSARDYSTDLVKLLLDFGAHIDEFYDTGKTLFDIIRNFDPDNADIFYIKYTSLKCLCARKILENDISYMGQIPKPLENFVKLHEFTGDFY